MEKYPDMTRLFAAKEARRRKLASLPIEEKMEIAGHLREMWRPLEPGETHGFQLKARSWGDRLKIAYILLTALWTLLTRGEVSIKVTRGPEN